MAEVRKFGVDDISYVDFTSPAGAEVRGIQPVDVRSFGAVGDGTTDDTAAINAAITAVTPTGGVVLLPSTQATGITAYAINSQIVVPENVVLRGTGGRTVELIALATFPTSTALVRLGAAGAEVFNSRLEHIGINCNNISGSIGVYATDIQDQCGLINVVVRGYGIKGVFFDGSAGTFGSINRYILRDVEAYSNNGDAGNIGIHLKGPSLWPPSINGISVEGQQATPIDQGIYVENGYFTMQNIYVGFADDGIKFSSTATGAVYGIYGNYCTDVLHMEGANVSVYSAQRASGTNIINDVPYGITLTDTAIGFYFSGQTVYSTTIVNKRALLTYSASIDVNVSNGKYFTIYVANNNAFTINTPTCDTVDGQEVTFDIYNNSGGAMTGTNLTWGAGYKVDVAWADMAYEKHRLITFVRINGVWREKSRSNDAL